MLRTLLALCVFASALFAQRNVSPENMYHRVWAVVPLVGAGTPEDPKRPMFVPSPTEAAADQANNERPDLFGYSMQLSDSGDFALVEFIVADPMAFESLLAKAIQKLPNLAANLSSLPAIAKNGSNARSIPSNVAARKAALEAAFPGLKLMERGNTSEAQILTEFRKLRPSFSLESLGRTQ